VQAILLQDIETLGERGTVVDVSAGYLRNYLIPRKLAEPATAGSIQAATKRRESAERALRESEERYRKLYDDAPVGYHEVDTEGRIVNVNLKECEILGYAREELIGRSVFDLLVPELRETCPIGCQMSPMKWQQRPA